MSPDEELLSRVQAALEVSLRLLDGHGAPLQIGDVQQARGALRAVAAEVGERLEPVDCPSCDGEGGWRDCGTCGGSGGGPDAPTRCWDCRGTGMRRQPLRCSLCDGDGAVMQSRARLGWEEGA